MRASRTSGSLWVKAGTLRRARYADVLQAHGEAFAEKYFDRVGKQRSAAAGLRLMAVAFQIGLFALLALSLVPGEGSSLIQPAHQGLIRDLREILLVTSAILGLGIPVLGCYHDVLTEILDADVERRSNGDADVQQMLKISHGMELFPLPPEKQAGLELGAGYRFLVRGLAALSAATFAAIMLGAIYIRFKVLEDIFFVPSYSAGVSISVIAFVVMTDILGLFIFILSIGPLRARKHEAIESGGM